jgi:hypothetical protein
MQQGKSCGRKALVFMKSVCLASRWFIVILQGRGSPEPGVRSPPSPPTFPPASQNLSRMKFELWSRINTIH